MWVRTRISACGAALTNAHVGPTLRFGAFNEKIMTYTHTQIEDDNKTQTQRAHEKASQGFGCGMRTEVEYTIN